MNAKLVGLLAVWAIGIFALSITPVFAHDDHVETTMLQDSKSDYFYKHGQITRSVHGTFDRLLDYTDANGNPVYVEARTVEDSNIIQVETWHGSVILNKSTCGFSYFKDGLITQGDTPLFTDSIVPKKANIAGDDWAIIQQLVDADCDAYQSGNKLIAEKYVAGLGTLQYSYIDTGGSWKTELIATNNSTATNQKFGFTQTIDLNRDTINFGGSTINLDNYHQQNFDNNWIQNNESKIIDLLNGQYFDFDLAHDNLWNIYVEDTGANKSKLAFDFVTTDALLPNETLILDPTFSSSESAQERLYKNGGGSGTACSTLGSPASDALNDIDLETGTGYCVVPLVEWDISSIPSGSDELILSASIEWAMQEATTPTIDCQWYNLDEQPSATSSANDWINVFGDFDGVTVDGDDCDTTGTKNQAFDDLTYLQTAIDADQTWYALAPFYVSQLRSDGQSGGHEITDGANVLEIIYIVGGAPTFPTGLTNSAEPYLINGTWTGCDFDGLTFNTCTEITGVSLWNTTDAYYAEQTLPESAGSDLEYSSATGSVDFADNEILFHFDSSDGNNEMQDVSGSNNNATALGAGGFSDYSDLAEYINFESGSGSVENKCDETASVDCSAHTTYTTDMTFNSASPFKDSYDGKMNNGGELSYTADYITGNSITMNLWFDDTDVTGNDSYMYQESSGIFTNYMAIYMDNSGDKVFCNFKTTGSTVATVTTVGEGTADSDFDMITCVLDIGLDEVRIYENAVLKNTSDLSAHGALPSSTQNSLWGNADGSASFEFEDSLDEISRWYRVLDATEILQLYNGGDGFDLINGEGVGLSLSTPTFEVGLFNNATTSFPLNFTSTDSLFETTSNSQVGGFVRLNNSESFNLLSFNNTSDEVVEFGIDATNQYVKFDGSTIASVTNDCNLFSWCFFGFDRSGNTFTFIQNETNKGTGSHTQNFGTAKDDMFYIGYNGTGISDTLIASLDEYYVNDGSDTVDALSISPRAFNTITWLQNYGNQTWAGCVGGISDAVACRVKLMNTDFNGTASDLIYGTTDGLPDAPTLSALGASETQIDFTRVAGASDGGDTISHYDLRCELNNTGGWLATVVNGTIASPYNYSGLVSGDDLTCQWRDRNAVGYSPYSSNATASTFEFTTGTTTHSSSTVVGNVALIEPTVTITMGEPSPTVNRLQLYLNGSLARTETVSQVIASGASNQWTDLLFVELDTGDIYNATVIARVTNTTGTVDISSAGELITREYAPIDYIAESASLGFYNYTFDSTDPQNRILKVNRPFDNATSSWDIGCKSITGFQDAGLTWYNGTDVGFFNPTLSASSGQNVYITCYNPPAILFSTVSYGNLTGVLAGFSGFDDQLGSWFGLPMIFMFVFFIAGLFGGRQSGTSMVITLSVIAILGGIGLIAIDEALWGIMLVLGALGLFASRVRF